MIYNPYIDSRNNANIILSGISIENSSYSFNIFLSSDKSCACGVATVNFNAATTDTIYSKTYKWYLNGVLSGSTLSAQTFNTSVPFVVTCEVTSAGIVVSSGLTVSSCPSMGITKTFSGGRYYYTADGGVVGMFDYYDTTGPYWVHGGSSSNQTSFSNISGISIIRFYFPTTVGYCGTIKTAVSDPPNWYTGEYYVQRAP